MRVPGLIAALDARGNHDSAARKKPDGKKAWAEQPALILGNVLIQENH
jgi:hypothetical protein